MTDRTTRTERERIEWRDFAVWEKNGRAYICHAADGDDCIGPFNDAVEAQSVLAVLAERTEGEAARENGRARDRKADTGYLRGRLRRFLADAALATTKAREETLIEHHAERIWADLAQYREPSHD